MTEARNWNEIRGRYNALLPLPDSGWDYTWIDRLRTWEDFLERGREVSTLLRLNQVSAADYEGDIRGLCPALHDLLMEAFPLTPEVQAEVEEWKADRGFIE